MTDITGWNSNRAFKSQASESLLEEVLNLSIFKQFLINQEHVALQKHIAHMATDDSIMESDYLSIWQSWIKYQLYQSLKEPS